MSFKTILKTVKYKPCLSFQACQKEIVEFSYSTQKIYWPTNLAKKAANN